MSLTDRRPSARRRTRGVRDESSATLAPPLPLVVAGAVAGAMAALLSFIALAVIALGAWMLDPAAPWEWSQMLEAGTAAWFAGQGVPLEVLGTPLSLSPLGFGVICLLAIASATRWATSAAAVARRGEAAAVAVSFALLYGAAAAVFAALARHLGVVPWQAGLICGAVALVLSTITLIVRVPLVTRDALPDLLRDGVAAALTGALVLLLFSGVALAAMIVIHADDVARVIGALEVGAAGALLVLVLSLGYLPVALVWTAAYLLGPGFALGTSATVSPFSEAGPATLPGLPLLAAVPATPPVWAAALPLVGVVAGAVMGFLLRRRGWFGMTGVALAAASCAAVAALAALTGFLASGSLGVGTLSTLGPSPLLFAGAALGTTILGAAVVVVWPPAADRSDIGSNDG